MTNDRPKKIDLKQQNETLVKLKRDLKIKVTSPNQRRAVDRLKLLRLGQKFPHTLE